MLTRPHLRKRCLPPILARQRFNRETSMPPVTTALLVASVALFMLQSVLPGIIVPFALWPLATASAGAGPSFMPWQIVTYAFLHGSLLHLAFNMFALYMFGGAIERVFGTRRYVLFYFVSLISAA